MESSLTFLSSAPYQAFPSQILLRSQFVFPCTGLEPLNLAWTVRSRGALNEISWQESTFASFCVRLAGGKAKSQTISLELNITTSSSHADRPWTEVLNIKGLPGGLLVGLKNDFMEFGRLSHSFHARFKKSEHPPTFRLSILLRSASGRKTKGTELRGKTSAAILSVSLWRCENVVRLFSHAVM